MRKDPRVDAYIAGAAPFAQPMLKHFRDAVHAGCPEVKETIKWSMPAFEYKGPMCGMAAFKEHAMFGFWKHSLLKLRGFGEYDRISSMDEMPNRANIVKLVKAARQLNDEGVKVVRVLKAKKSPLKVPPYFTTALKKVPKAAAVFEAFSPTNKREYVEWITGAKTDETRDRRLAQALEWIAQGKSRNWKYQC